MYHGNKKLLAACVFLALGSNVAHATQSAVLCTPITGSSDNGGNFTMLTPIGGMQGGTNDLVFNWDGTMFNNQTDYTGLGSVANVTIASNQAFSSFLWTAHDVQLFGPGNYTFDSATPGGNAEAGNVVLTVASNQFGMHMLFDWGGSAPTNTCGVANCNIDVAIVLNKNANFSSLGTFENPATCTTSSPNANCLWNTGPASSFAGGATANRPAANKTWMLASVDGNGDGIPGIPMAGGGPFGNFNANFSFNGTLAPADGVCAPAQDTTPDPFSFTAVTNASLSTLYTSNSITVSGLGVNPPGVGITAPISISGGGSPQYSINGGPYTSSAGTVANGDTVTVQATSGSADGITVNATLTIGGVPGSYVISTPAVIGASGSNFTMIDAANGVTGGTNDVAASWDNSCATSTTSTVFPMTLSSTTPFSSYVWTAHHIRVFCPGTYTINTDNTECTTNMLETTGCTPSATASNNYTFTVGAGQYGAHMLFNWNNAVNIDVIQVWEQSAVFGPSPMHTGRGACNSPLTVWDLMSTDWDSDGKNGGAMIDGPFTGFSANFNIRLTGTPLACSDYVPTVAVGDPSGSKGCSIGTMPVKAAERADWWLVAAFLAWLGALRKRFKRQA